MGNAKGNVISAQVFVSGERRYWAEKKKNKQKKLHMFCHCHFYSNGAKR